jgi:hypothetical protein
MIRWRPRVAGKGASVRSPHFAAPRVALTPSSGQIFLAVCGFVACALGLIGGCSVRQAAPKALSTADARPAVTARVRAAAPRTESGPAHSHPIATLAGRALGPFVARGAGGGLLAWIARADKGDGQDLMVVPVAADGAPLRPPRAVARVSQEATFLVVESVAGSRGGWLLAWSALLDRGESLTVLGLTAEGSVRGSARDVERTSDHIKWAKVVPTSHGALCVWAEETPAGDANILSVAIDVDGAVRGLPMRVARGVDGWQAVSVGEGAGLALVAIGPVGDRAPAGSLTWLRLDADGHPQGSSVTVSAQGTVSSDVEVVAVRDGWLMAWTDRTGEDPRVMLASVDEMGRVRGPSPAMDAVGGSSVVGLASGPAGTALAWEEPHTRIRPERELHLATVSDADLVARSQSSIVVASGQRAELVATGSGFAVLALARECATGGAGPCSAQILPTFVRLGAHLEVVQSEPFFVGDGGDPAAIGWGLRCRQMDRCFAFAAPAATPTPIYSIDLAPRSSPYAAPLPATAAGDAPRVTGVETIASGQDYEDLAAVRIGPTTLVATMTNAIDVPRGRRRGRGAKIALRAVDDDGRPVAPARTLSSRALSAGGIAIATETDTNADPQAAVAWIARDEGAPEVHVALLDRSGQTVRERRLTGANRDASSVAIAAAGGGWIVAWVDDRDGNGDVYATRLDGSLSRTASDQRIRRAPGDASDLALAVGDDVAWIAWSDPRESPRDGVADIFAATLRLQDASRAGDEVRVLSTAIHSRSPSLVAMPTGEALVGWIEAAPAGIDAPGAAMVARLDRQAHVVGVPWALPLPFHGRPTEVALQGGAGGVRAVVVEASRDGLSMDGFRLGGEDSSAIEHPSDLLDLDAPASFDVTLALAGDAVVFSDVGASPGDRRVRRAAVAWKR